MERKSFGLPQSRFTKGNSETSHIVTPPSDHFLCEPPPGPSNETAALKKVEEYPFTPSIKSTNWRGDDMRSPITPAASPRVTSHPASLESRVGEVEGLSIHRLRISAGLPSLFQRPFSSPASEFTSTPKRKSTVAEISPGKSSSPIRLTGSSVKPFSTSTQMEKNHLSSELQCKTSPFLFLNATKEVSHSKSVYI
ncbi:hypothetical protein DAPPUDRAFT_233535 [Daphnia pulex]|uniref:Uncharacterized protein n=1 Tax=Daphnia pulex TaxID=6669 RepID=E9FV24_DAPPU|nr:hypothetical protein DAPPUDRAFT_233535 [Daphnia pulex]|eukprot:EFX89179.1 hypothetical protein DAPPUDRAFT_233535 [Daphnia pulex]